MKEIMQHEALKIRPLQEVIFILRSDMEFGYDKNTLATMRIEHATRV